MHHDVELSALLPAVASKLLGDPNKALSNGKERRYGRRGSLSLDLPKGVWHDHEIGQGGGVLDLIRHKTGLSGAAAWDWLREEGLIEDDGARAPEKPAKAKPKKKLGKIVDISDYPDENGELLFQVVRYEPKDFRQRRPDDKGGYIWNIDGVRRVPYRLPEVLARPEGAPVFIVEGEKDVDRLRSLGLVATCNPMGCGEGKWLDEFNQHFADADVIVIPDEDDPEAEKPENRTSAIDHARRVCAAVSSEARSVKLLRLPGLSPKQDVSDWLDAGGAPEELIALADAAPEWEPDLAEAETMGEPLRSPAIVREEFPAPMDRAVYHGVIGAIVQAIEPETEADPAAVLVMMLVAVGTSIGRTAHSLIASLPHYCNLFAVIVGETSKARKSTAWALVRQIIEAAERTFAARIAGGVASGEALISLVRDSCEEDDPGVSDKRLLVNEEEFARGLRVARRDGSIYPDVLRQAWDGQTLANRTKKSPMVATHPHIGLIGTITRHELGKQFQDVDAANGLANRFLWVAARRARCLPLGGRPIDIDGLSRRLSGALLLARRDLSYSFDDEAEAEWRRIYPALSAGSPGLLGAVTGRAEAQVWRMAMIYAALDGSTGDIRIEHLRAALAVWDYCERSARWVFGGRLGDPVAEDILEALFEAGDRGMTRTEIRNLFGRHKRARLISLALDELRDRGLVVCRQEPTAGRSREVWRCAKSD